MAFYERTAYTNLPKYVVYDRGVREKMQIDT